MKKTPCIKPMTMVPAIMFNYFDINHVQLAEKMEMFPEHLTHNGGSAFGKQVLLVEEEVPRWASDDDQELRSRHAGILLDDSIGEAGSWYGWGDGEGMYLEGERGDWTGWGGGRLQVEESGEGASQDQTWGMYGLEEEYEWGGTDQASGRYGEKEVKNRFGDSQAELEELDTLQRGGRRRRRRRRRPWKETAGARENTPPEAGGFEDPERDVD